MALGFGDKGAGLVTDRVEDCGRGCATHTSETYTYGQPGNYEARVNIIDDSDSKLLFDEFGNALTATITIKVIGGPST